MLSVATRAQTISIEDVSEKPIVIDKPEIYTSVESVPGFVGGDVKFMEYLKEKMQTPKNAAAYGRVLITLVVERNGKFSDIKILRQVSPEVDAEALRLIKNSPKWRPGTIGGKAVRTQYTIPIDIQKPE